MGNYFRTIAIFLILLLSLLIRLHFVAGIDVKPSSDMHDYDQRAMLLADKGTFNTNDVHGATYRAPGYVVFLATCYKLFGHTYGIVYDIQSILGVAMLIAIYLLGKQLFDKDVALLALILAALYVPFIGYAGMLMSETLFITLLLFAIYAFVRAIMHQRVAWFLIAGALFGFATLTRSIALIVPFILIIWLMIRESRLVFPWQTWKRILFMLLVMCCLIAPWTIRNTVLQKQFVFVDTVSGLNLLIGNNPYANGFYSDSIYKVPAYKHAETVAKTPAQADQIMKRGALKWIAENPGNFIKLTYKRFQIYLASQTDLNGVVYKWKNIGWFSDTFNANYQWDLISLAIVGAVVALLRNRSALLPVIGAAYFIGAMSVFYVQTRYRLPAMPFVILLAAFTLWQLRRGGRMAFFIVVCGYLTHIWLESTAIGFHV